MAGRIPIERLEVATYGIPTATPESDGTLEWDSTTMVLVEAHAGGRVGIGYSYTDAAAAKLIQSLLRTVVLDTSALDLPRVWSAMRRAVRNAGRPGIASCAISAVDTALWDLKARLLELPLVSLLGAIREEVPVYGSGGFTSYSPERLQEQLAGWVAEGISRVKMKVGRNPSEDLARVRAAREAVGSDAALFVDANGAYSRKQALAFAEEFAACGVSWLEEPVSSDDLEGLRFLRDRAPAGMDVTAGEYGYDLVYFRRMLEAGAVDVLQADVTRCGGVSELIRADALCAAHGIPLSTHTAPALHAHAACALESIRHVEYFYDHVRIERLLFDGALDPSRGMLKPDLSRHGNGLVFKRQDAARFAI